MVGQARAKLRLDHGLTGGISRGLVIQVKPLQREWYRGGKLCEQADDDD